MVLIRKMAAGDVEPVSAVMCACYRWLGQRHGYTAEQLEYLLNERGSVGTVKRESQEQDYLVACVQDMVAAVAAIDGSELAKLYVHPDYHDQRIGKSLFESAQRIIAEAGYEEMIAGAKSVSAVGFYEKMGMRVAEIKLVKSGVFTGFKVSVMKKRTGSG